SMLLKSDGTVWTMGSNYDGQLGIDTTSTQLLPVQVSYLTDVAAIACGTSTSMAQKGNGTTWLWGGNSNGQVGDGTATNRLGPVPISSLPHSPAFAVGTS